MRHSCESKPTYRLGSQFNRLGLFFLCRRFIGETGKTRTTNSLVIRNIIQDVPFYQGVVDALGMRDLGKRRMRWAIRCCQQSGSDTDREVNQLSYFRGPCCALTEYADGFDTELLACASRLATWSISCSGASGCFPPLVERLL